MTLLHPAKSAKMRVRIFIVAIAAFAALGFTHATPIELNAINVAVPLDDNNSIEAVPHAQTTTTTTTKSAFGIITTPVPPPSSKTSTSKKVESSASTSETLETTHTTAAASKTATSVASHKTSTPSSDSPPTEEPSHTISPSTTPNSSSSTVQTSAPASISSTSISSTGSPPSSSRRRPPPPPPPPSSSSPTPDDPPTTKNTSSTPPPLPPHFASQLPRNWPYTKYAVAYRPGQTATWILTSSSKTKSMTLNGSASENNESGVPVAILEAPLLWFPRPLAWGEKRRADLDGDEEDNDAGRGIENGSGKTLLKKYDYRVIIGEGDDAAATATLLQGAREKDDHGGNNITKDKGVS
ncbi:unnamed protein product [Periconia digitata]|uniref:Uncharacterized protein n=1 Tax=Periconia digitata TaxID=1303443 RepID=A0A9W4UJG3_9PLEO|nr:unnamed protein product [Periconia digitata]